MAEQPDIFALSMPQAVFPSALLIPATPISSGSGRERTCLSVPNVALQMQLFDGRSLPSL